VLITPRSRAVCSGDFGSSNRPGWPTTTSSHPDCRDYRQAETAARPCAPGRAKIAGLPGAIWTKGRPRAQTAGLSVEETGMQGDGIAVGAAAGSAAGAKRWEDGSRSRAGSLSAAKSMAPLPAHGPSENAHGRQQHPVLGLGLPPRRPGSSRIRPDRGADEYPGGALPSAAAQQMAERRCY
jgi:hypothetical protein